MYRKLRADTLFDGHRFLTGGEVLVTDENGRIAGIVSGHDVTDAENFSGTLCPGFVNAHCHLELSWMKSLIPEGSGMIDFLLAVIHTPKASREEAVKAMGEAEAYMLDSGIVAVGDICNTSATVDVKKEENLYYFNFIEALGFIEAAAQERFQQAVQVFNEFADLYPLPLERNSIVPHSPYSVSRTLFEKIIAFPGNRLLSMHNQEHAAENEFFLEGTGDFHRLYQALGINTSFHKATGNTSLANVLPLIRRNQSLLLVHNVETSEQDMRLIADAINKGIEPWLCLCPNANQYINQQLPDVAMIRRHTDKIVLGTDSLASNHQLNIVSEMKTIHRSFPDIPVTDLLQWATSNGSKAFDIYGETGSFEPGKQPGIVLLTGFSHDAISANATSKRIL